MIRLESQANLANAPAPAAVTKAATSVQHAQPRPGQADFGGDNLNARLQAAPGVIPTVNSTAVVQPLPPVTPSIVPSSQRSGVQMLMLIVGISLVAIALTFFVVYAWVVGGHETRAAIVASFTLLAFGAVSVLQRMHLATTAQGIGTLAVLLVYLTTWAAQGLPIVVDAQLDGALFWGVSLLAMAPLLALWSRVTRVRAASVAAFASIPLAFALLAWGATPQIETATRLWLSAIAAIVGSLVYLAVPGVERATPVNRMLRTERTVVQAQAVAAATLALILAFFVEENSSIAPSWAFGILATALLLHIVLSMVLTSAQDLWSTLLAPSLLGLSLTAIPLVIALRLSFNNSDVVMWPIMIAVAITLALDASRSKMRLPQFRRVLLAASLGSATLSAIGALVPFLIAAALLAERRASINGYAFWSQSELLRFEPSGEQIQAALVLLGILLITIVAWFASGQASRRALWLQGLGAVVAMTSIGLVPSQAIAISLFVALGTVALLIALFRPELRERVCRSDRALPLALTTSIIALLSAYTLSFTAPLTWLATSLVILAALIAARHLGAGNTRIVLRKVLLACAVAFGLLTTLGIPDAFPGSGLLAQDGAALLIFSSAFVMLAFALPLAPWAQPAERVWALAPASLSYVIASIVGVTQNWEMTTTAILLATLGSFAALGAIGAAIMLRTNAALRMPRFAALALCAVALWHAGAWAFSYAHELNFAFEPVVTQLWPAAAALMVFALALAHRLSATAVDVQESARDRLLLDSGAAGLLIVALINALAIGDSLILWCSLLLASIGLLLAAIDHTGLFNRLSLRHTLGWLSLMLATSALWVALSSAQISNPEPYTLPLSAALLLIAALVARFGEPAVGPRDLAEPPLTTQRFRSVGTAGITASGLLIGFIPSAIAGTEGTVLRPILTIATAGIVLLAGCLWRAAPAYNEFLVSPLRIALIGAGTIGVLTTSWLRAFTTLEFVNSAGVPIQFEVWVLVAFAVLLAAAFTLSEDSPAASSVLLALALGGTTIAQLVALSAATNAGVDDAGLAIRSAATVCVLSATYFALKWRKPPFVAQWIAPMTLALASSSALSYLVILASRPADLTPFEIVTVPLGCALIGAGLLQLNRVPTASSWRSLAPGLGIIFAPALLTNYTGTELWRVVAVGVVALGALIYGQRRDLQAPFIIGAAVLLIHGLAQLWPWIEDLYAIGFWWLWLGIGGILLIAMAANYEKRMRGVKIIAAHMGAMR